MSEAKKITKWAPVAGLWDFATGNPIYSGPQKRNQPYGKPFGICVSDVWFQGGRAEVTVSLPGYDVNGFQHEPSAGILFGYRSIYNDYLFVTLGGWHSAYSLGRFRPAIDWLGYPIVGSHENLHPEQPYSLSVHMQGQKVTFEVDGVQVLTHVLETAPPQGQLGLYAWGDSRVEFNEASVTEEAGKVFVIVPFSDYYLNELFPGVIEPTVREEGNNLVAHHAGEALGPGVIIKDIEKDISESKIVIADITGCNQNVYYEVGFAHASQVPTILLVQEGTDLPFDLSGYRCIFYQNTIAGKDKIIQGLRENIKEILGR
jgi:hypothetical protein